jgi:DNA modification methylase
VMDDVSTARNTVASPAAALPFRREIIGNCELYLGDMREVLPTISGVHSCVTDPPYELGFMGREWDRSGIAVSEATWLAVLDALLPGAHLVAFAGSRTYHLIASAIHSSGFEIRDQLMWIYGSGFPKSHDVSKGIDRAAGAEREVVGPSRRHGGGSTETIPDYNRFGTSGDFITAPATPEAAQWSGWGTALKPAHEPIAFARKPLSESSIASNVLKHGTGAINVDAGRVAAPEGLTKGGCKRTATPWHLGSVNSTETTENPLGRWPANVITDGSFEVYEMFPPSARDSIRFFYSAKVNSEERDGSTHPTMKPVDLMRWLCRLITPPNGIILDPFMGSGSTGIAAIREGFRFIGVEQSPEYFEIACRRIKAAASANQSDMFIASPEPKPQQLSLMEPAE